MKHFRPRLSRRAFWVLCALLVCLRLALTGFQQAYIWVGGAPLDDELMFRAANAITSDEAAAAYREAAAGDADGSGNVGGTSTASQTTTVSSNDIASTEHEFLVLGLIPKVKNTIALTITDTDGNLKAQYKMVLSSGCICRVYQYGFRGFYFA